MAAKVRTALLFLVFGLVAALLVRCRRGDGVHAATVNAAVRVLEEGFADTSPRLQEVSFGALTTYHCHDGDATKEPCLQLVSRAASHAGWRVRLMNLPNAFKPETPQLVRAEVVTRAARDDNESLPRAVSKLLADHATSADRPLLLELIGSGDGVVREHAAAGLVRLGERRYADVLEQGLASGDREEVLEAARHVIDLETGAEPRAVALLKDMLLDRDEIVRANAIYGMSELRDPPWDGDTIARSLNDLSPMVRLAMVTSLPMITVPAVPVETSFDLLVRRWPQERAGEMRLEILKAADEMARRPGLRAALVTKFLDIAVEREENDQVKLVGMGILACRTHPEYTQDLIDVARDARRNVTDRLLSLSSIGHCRDTKIVQALNEIMEAQTGADEDSRALRVACAAAIVRALTADPASPGAARYTIQQASRKVRETEVTPCRLTQGSRSGCSWPCCRLHSRA